MIFQTRNSRDFAGRCPVAKHMYEMQEGALSGSDPVRTQFLIPGLICYMSGLTEQNPDRVHFIGLHRVTISHCIHILETYSSTASVQNNRFIGRMSRYDPDQDFPVGLPDAKLTCLLSAIVLLEHVLQKQFNELVFGNAEQLTAYVFSMLTQQRK